MLENYLPENSVQPVLDLIDEYKFLLRITKSRTSKLADYSHPQRGKPHKITINHNLDKYLFLITLIHEIAHLTSWNRYKGKILPHGKEWKEEYKFLLKPFIQSEIFPDDIKQCLNDFSINPRASSCADISLMKVLKKYDRASEFIHLEELPHNSTFRLKNGHTFIKGNKLRKRYICTNASTKRNYLISPVAEVIQTSLF